MEDSSDKNIIEKKELLEVPIRRLNNSLPLTMELEARKKVQSCSSSFREFPLTRIPVEVEVHPPPRGFNNEDLEPPAAAQIAAGQPPKIVVDDEDDELPTIKEEVELVDDKIDNKGCLTEENIIPPPPAFKSVYSKVKVKVPEYVNISPPQNFVDDQVVEKQENVGDSDIDVGNTQIQPPPQFEDEEIFV